MYRKLYVGTIEIQSKKIIDLNVSTNYNFHFLLLEGSVNYISLFCGKLLKDFKNVGAKYTCVVSSLHQFLCKLTTVPSHTSVSQQRIVITPLCSSRLRFLF